MSKLKCILLTVSWLLLFLYPFNSSAQEQNEREFNPDSIDAKYQILYNYDSTEDLITFKNSLEIKEITMEVNIHDAALSTSEPPSYNISIFKNGNVKFEGEKNLKLIGKYRSTISPKMFVRLCYYIERINFKSIKPTFNISMHADIYKFIVKYEGGTEKSFIHFGSLEPIFLWGLNRIIDNLRSTLEWQKVQ